MVNTLTPELYPAGAALFLGSESYLKDLSEEDESNIAGGKRSRSGRAKRRRPRRNRRRRAVRRPNRSRSVSRT